MNESYRGFGLTSDKDLLWTKDRETQKQQTKRATDFLYDVFGFIENKVVLVVTHSGFARSVLLAVGREPYRPQNTELIPILVQKIGTRLGEQEEQEQEQEEEEEEEEEEQHEEFERHSRTKYDYDYREKR